MRIIATHSVEIIKRKSNFAERTEEAWKRHDKGEFVSMPADKFLKKLSKC